MPDVWTGISHPLTLVVCDTADDPVRAGRHLIEDLAVPAIVGPNSSDDTLDLATRLSIEKRVLTMSPTAMASSLRDLADNDLSWSIVPTDTQRAPLLHAQIKALEVSLRKGRPEPVKLSVVYRDDSFGHGVRLSLSSLTINELPLSHPDNVESAVQWAMYAPTLDDVPSLIAAQLAFKPDIILLAGTAEAADAIMLPLEERLSATSSHRPHYVLTDGSKSRELLQLVQRYPDLAARVHGIGSAPSDDFAWSVFERAYRARFAEAQPQLAGVAAAYDSVYAIGFAAAASGGTVEGPDLAVGLREIESEAKVAVPADLAGVFKELERAAPNSHLVAQGALSPFSWDERGAPRKGKLELWCVGQDGQSFVSGGVTFELGSEPAVPSWENASACALSPVEPRPDTPGTAVGTPEVQQPPAASEPALLDDESDAGVGEPAPSPEPERPELYVEYRSANANPIDALIGPWIRVGNRGTGTGVPLPELKLRYYVTNESNPLCVRDCVAELFWAGVLPRGERVPAKLEYVTSGWLTGYLELSFEQGAPLLRPNEYMEAQLEFHTGDYQSLDETNDFSFDAAHREFAEFRRVAVYRGNQLVWGDV
ncbi:MAG TPA: cellulose binding domain-containing protein, partial [Polyangiales bacterium]|nr:cellulose binding domain-containing protein [Polyangiales bacterium]